MRTFFVLLLFLPVLAWGDFIKLKDGQTMYGIVRTIDDGKVTIEIGGEPRRVQILEVEQIEFDAPHVADVPDREFTKAAEQLIQAEKEIRRSVDPERFDGLLSDYRKAIHQMYLDLAAHLDNYNKLAADTAKLKDFIPGNWYDHIYYEAYKEGFGDRCQTPISQLPRADSEAVE